MNRHLCSRTKVILFLFLSTATTCLYLSPNVILRVPTAFSGYVSNTSRIIPATVAVDNDSRRIFNESQLTIFLQKLRNEHVKEIRSTTLGTWAVRKGLNNMATLSDGDKVLIKERRNYSLQGELFSYYLNCYLEMWNTPPTALRCVRTTYIKVGETKKYNRDRRENESEGCQKENGEGMGKRLVLSSRGNDSPLRCYVVSSYVEAVRKADRVYIPYFSVSLPSNASKLSLLLEWSDLIVFDFLTGHSDRLLDNYYQLLPRVDYIARWKKVPNLLQTSAGHLMLIDHESTFHRCYERARQNSETRRKQYYFLAAVNVFRKRTVKKLCGLCEARDPVSVLEEYISAHDPVSLEVTSSLEPIDRIELKSRLLYVCDNTCHLLK